MPIKILSILMMFVTVVFSANLYAEEKKPPHPQFELLTSLVGNWKGFKNEDNKQPILLKYELSSGGNAVIEHLFLDSPMEMVTVYHKNGDKVLMTHYCSMGNQPRMQSGKLKNKNKIAFKFLDITNLKNKASPHMHDMTLSILDNDNLQHEWTMYTKGKAKQTSVMKFTRID